MTPVFSDGTGMSIGEIVTWRHDAAGEIVVAMNLLTLMTEQLAQAMGVPAGSLAPDTELDDEIWEAKVVETLWPDRR
jgi:hypothetical protein